VLTLRVPKPEQLRPRRIEVRQEDSGQPQRIEGATA
jgi:hypothetical protein